MLAPLNKSLTLDDLLDPQSKAWKKLKGEKVRLVGTPVGLQPTDYIRTKWESQPPGSVSQASVKALHNGQTLAFHLKWKDETDNSGLSNTNQFPDAAAVAVSTASDPSFATMGTPESPLNVWYWRADASNSGRQVTSTGIGTTETVGEGVIKARGQRTGKGWSVVIARDLRVAEQELIAQLQVGSEIKCALAIWEGSSEERGGLKGFSPVPLSVTISE